MLPIAVKYKSATQGTMLQNSTACNKKMQRSFKQKWNKGKNKKTPELLQVLFLLFGMKSYFDFWY
jgi:hypothetical protein